MGDPAGIGGEIILKALPELCRTSIPVIIGDRVPMETLSALLFGRTPFPFKGFMKGEKGDGEFIDLSLLSHIDFGHTGSDCGKAAYRYIIEGLKHVFSGEVSALVTGPISKASIHEAGIPFTGHTELLAHYGGTRDYVMMMANRDMRVSLATIHIPLKEVPGALSAAKIFKTIMITHHSLKEYFGIREPAMKVSGLNPHAGESGTMGNEEEFIEDAILRARSLNVTVDGPFPGDTLFHRRDCDAFIAMYHDQGLIPVKTVDFRRTVNITLGLPFIRTSPGHGTGFDIAGKGLADPASLVEAYRMAERMAFHIE